MSFAIEAQAPGPHRTSKDRKSRNRAAGRQRTTEYDASLSDNVLLALLCLVLLTAPIPLGANRIWAWSVLEVAIFGLVLAWALLNLFGKRKVLPERAGACLAFLGAWLLYLCLYLVPVPGGLLKALSPDLYSSYQDTYRTFEYPDASYYFTLDRYRTFLEILKYAMYASVFLLTTALVKSRSQLRILLYTLLAAGVVEVVMAMGARTMGVDLVPRKLLDGHFDVLRGTFVNRNHFSAFLAMTASAGVGLFLASMERAYSGATLRARIAAIMDSLEGPTLFTGGAVALIGTGMIMSSSRGGIGALSMSVVLVLALSVAARGLKARELILVWPLGLGIVGAAVWSGSRHLIERVLATGVIIPERWIQWRATWDLITDHWLTGVGPGAYQYAFTAYKNASLRPLVYDHAHNDYLELLAEQGVLGAVLLATAVVAILAIVTGAFFRRRDILARAALFASLTGMLTILIHSLVEFDFHIPAVALYFWVLAGIGVSAARLEHKVRRLSEVSEETLVDPRVVRT